MHPLESLDGFHVTAAACHLFVKEHGLQEQILAPPRLRLLIGLRRSKRHPAEGRSASLLRKLMNLFSTRLGTDINRRLGHILHGCPGAITHTEASIAGGMYEVILLQKIGGF